jgi:hypothetical protein
MPPPEDRSDEDNQRLAPIALFGVVEFRHAERNDRDLARRDAEVADDFVARKRRVSEHDPGAAGRPGRERLAPPSFSPAEPLRVRGERHVVNGQCNRARRGERRAVARGKQDVRPVRGEVAGERPLFPARATGAGQERERMREGDRL